jgi:hypothetical protein
VTRDLQALAEAGLRDAVLAELQQREIDDLSTFAGMTDAELRRIPNVGVRAIGIIRAVIEASSGAA